MIKAILFDLDDTLYDIALEKFDLYKKDLVLKLIEIYRKHSARLFPYPDALATLSKLKKRYKLGLITDGNVTVQQRKIEALNIWDFFDVVILSDRYGGHKQKPSPPTSLILVTGIYWNGERDD